MNKLLSKLAIVTGLLALSIPLAQAAQETVRTEQDIRNATVNFQNHNIIRLYSALGYATTLNFPADEEVTGYIVGIEDAWSISVNGSSVFIKPLVGVNPSPREDDINDNVLIPKPEDWKTNLVVLTSKAQYQFELNYVEPSSEKLLLSVNVQSAARIVEKAKELKKAKQEEQQKRAAELREERAKQVKQALDKEKSKVTKLPIPKDWAYAYLSDKSSASILPVFTYADSKFMYMGFAPSSPLPRPYKVLEADKEALVDTLTFDEGGITVLVVKGIYPEIILRHESKVVKVISKGSK